MQHLILTGIHFADLPKDYLMSRSKIYEEVFLHAFLPLTLSILLNIIHDGVER